MPTYSYECQSCKDRLNIFQKMSDPSLEDCDSCGKKKVLKRLISGGTGMVFKGSGFYLTDYTQYGKNPKSKKDTSETKIKKNKDTKKE
jgi:putative FmdB family regulatory protein